MARRRIPDIVDAALPPPGERGGALLATKLFVPPARPELVPRPRLYAALDVGMRRKLTLLAAPAGSGKTTLIGAWRATQASGIPAPTGVALDGGENDPARFWSYAGAALEALHPGAGRPVAALLGATPPPREVALTGLINALAALPRDVALVLDDYHSIDNPAIHDGVTFLLDHLPPRLHLILSGRADPPLPLARLRARGELLELRATDLRFTPAEAATFLWLDSDLTEAEHIVPMLRPYPAGQIDGYTIGRGVNLLQIATVDLIPPVSSATRAA